MKQFPLFQQLPISLGPCTISKRQHVNKKSQQLLPGFRICKADILNLPINSELVQTSAMHLPPFLKHSTVLHTCIGLFSLHFLVFFKSNLQRHFKELPFASNNPPTQPSDLVHFTANCCSKLAFWEWYHCHCFQHIVFECSCSLPHYGENNFKVIYLVQP